MNILAVDTSANTATVAILNDDKLLAEEIVNHKKTHSETLMPMIDLALKRCDMDISDIDLFAVANGPGSFTGLRIGVSTIKGLAHGLSKPVVEVSTLEGMAYNLFLADGIISPIMDARRSQVYNAVYQWEEGTLKELTPPRALSIEECVEDLLKYNKKVILLGDGVPVHREYIKSAMGDMAVFAPASCNDQRASSLASVAMGKHEKKTAHEVTPVYLRKPQAERELEEKLKGENIK